MRGYTDHVRSRDTTSIERVGGACRLRQIRLRGGGSTPRLGTVATRSSNVKKEWAGTFGPGPQSRQIRLLLLSAGLEEFLDSLESVFLKGLKAIVIRRRLLVSSNDARTRCASRRSRLLSTSSHATPLEWLWREITGRVVGLCVGLSWTCPIHASYTIAPQSISRKCSPSPISIGRSPAAQ